MAEGGTQTLRVTVAASVQVGVVQEWSLQLKPGATLADALRACGLDLQRSQLACGIWGRAAAAHEMLRDGDRVECCRPLVVDPKLARRARFKAQGARAAGLFARQRPGSKAGY